MPRSRRRFWPPDSVLTRARGLVLEADEGDHLVDVARRRVVAGEERVRLAHREVRPHARLLEHDADPLAPAAARALRVLAEHGHVAAVARPVALEDLDRRRLAGAVRAEEPEDLALGDLEAHAAQRLVGAVRLAQLVDGDRGHAAPASCRPAASSSDMAPAPSPTRGGDPRSPGWEPRTRGRDHSAGAGPRLCRMCADFVSFPGHEGRSMAIQPAGGNGGGGAPVSAAATSAAVRLVADDGDRLAAAGDGGQHVLGAGARREALVDLGGDAGLAGQLGTRLARAQQRARQQRVELDGLLAPAAAEGCRVGTAARREGAQLVRLARGGFGMANEVEAHPGSLWGGRFAPEANSQSDARPARFARPRAQSPRRQPLPGAHAGAARRAPALAGDLEHPDPARGDRAAARDLARQPRRPGHDRRRLVDRVRDRPPRAAADRARLPAPPASGGSTSRSCC